jgi:predicted nucleic acid-binding protein
LFALLARGVVEVDFSLQAEHERVARLMAKYKEVPMALADGCIVRKAELVPGSRVWTLDRDFKVYRRNGRQRIPLLTPW